MASSYLQYLSYEAPKINLGSIPGYLTTPTQPKVLDSYLDTLKVQQYQDQMLAEQDKRRRDEELRTSLSGIANDSTLSKDEQFDKLGREALGRGDLEAATKFYSMQEKFANDAEKARTRDIQDANTLRDYGQLKEAAKRISDKLGYQVDPNKIPRKKGEGDGTPSLGRVGILHGPNNTIVEIGQKDPRRLILASGGYSPIHNSVDPEYNPQLVSVEQALASIQNAGKKPVADALAGTDPNKEQKTGSGIIDYAANYFGMGAEPTPVPAPTPMPRVRVALVPKIATPTPTPTIRIPKVR